MARQAGGATWCNTQCTRSSRVPHLPGKQQKSGGLRCCGWLQPQLHSLTFCVTLSTASAATPRPAPFTPHPAPAPAALPFACSKHGKLRVPAATVGRARAGGWRLDQQCHFLDLPGAQVGQAPAAGWSWDCCDDGRKWVLWHGAGASLGWQDVGTAAPSRQGEWGVQAVAPAFAAGGGAQ